MNQFEMIAVVILVLCVSGVIVVDRFLGTARRAGEQQVKLAEQRIQELVTRLSELERHNDELRQQLEWNRRLLEAQDRVLQQLGSSSTPRDMPSAQTPLSRV